MKSKTFIPILSLFFILNNSCKKNNLAIGDEYGGGKVFYILVKGDPGYSRRHQHGLIASSADIKNSQGTFLLSWGCGATDVSGAEGRALGTGAQNTMDIVAGCPTPEKAARMCSDLVLNGEEDWYLPSVDELEKLYKNMGSVGGFDLTQTPVYWSSTEEGVGGAWRINFADGKIDEADKDGYIHVRAIRSF
jgi:hypothetical protein